MFPEKVLAHLYHQTFYCKLKKCSFLYNSTMFFGFYIMPEGMHISDLKVQSLKKQPVPTIVKKVWSVLGFVQYFCKNICNFSAIAGPLHKLTHKDESSAWTDLCQLMFEELKNHMVSASILKIYDGSANIQVELHTNARAKVLGIVLLQKHTAAKYFQPIAYYSKKLNNAQ